MKWLVFKENGQPNANKELSTTRHGHYPPTLSAHEEPIFQPAVVSET